MIEQLINEIYTRINSNKFDAVRKESERLRKKLDNDEKKDYHRINN